jgi:hypothetical protein
MRRGKERSCCGSLGEEGATSLRYAAVRRSRVNVSRDRLFGYDSMLLLEPVFALLARG